jgi:hypothetical protein
LQVTGGPTSASMHSRTYSNRLTNRRSDEDPSSSQQYVIQVPGALIYPIVPDIQSPGQDQVTCTWTISHEQLEDVLQLAWAALDPDSEHIISNVGMLPGITKVNLPYKREPGM